MHLHPGISTAGPLSQYIRWIPVKIGLDGEYCLRGLGSNRRNLVRTPHPLRRQFASEG